MFTLKDSFDFLERSLQTESEIDLMRFLERCLALVPNPIRDSDERSIYLETLDGCRKYLYENLSPFFVKPNQNLL